MTTLYGIPNCDTIKKARKWLTDNGVDYDFYDYKKHGVDETLLQSWIDSEGWETLLNRRGMMWRKLSQNQRNTINEKNAIKLMLSTPSIIKRPVLVMGDQVLIGFDEAKYKDLF